MASRDVEQDERGAKRQKRQNVIDWDTYFMATAFLARHRSKDPDYQVGACIINDDKKIVGTGYNGFPLGCSDDEFSWDKRTDESRGKHDYVCHAEMNAIIFRNTTDVKGCTMYVTLFPCNECAKIIIQSGIKKVIYFSDEKNDKPEFKASKPMFIAAGVDIVQLEPKKKIEIVFSPESLAKVPRIFN
ncbi:hypothetical protein PYW07_014857 [Mythimna separata]|uniref:Probable deoxycytidylate deaminase n=1 Tax=Mythimna separata TaxID=271217 RepID=A0AAD8E0I3_MYTSE|nr:hypothetical protein PYW07_014857 [Mythimna separata]